jgi:hypothetical protein
LALFDGVLPKIVFDGVSFDVSFCFDLGIFYLNLLLISILIVLDYSLKIALKSNCLVDKRI